MSSKQTLSRAARTAGFSLVVVLLIMVALSMVGIASLRGVSLQEKMAGNLYFRAVALAESESALRATVAKLDSLVGLGVGVALPADAADADWKTMIHTGSNTAYWAASGTWSNTSTRAAMSQSASGMTVNATTEQLMPASPLMRNCEAKLTGAGSACDALFTRMTSRVEDTATGASVVVQQFWTYPPQN